jgi:hypothetical protein
VQARDGARAPRGVPGQEDRRGSLAIAREAVGLVDQETLRVREHGVVSEVAGEVP